MTVKQMIGLVVAGAAVGGFATHRRQSLYWADGSNTRRWLGVTIARSPQEVSSAGKVPEPLARLGDMVEVQVRPAAGDKGTELYARLRQIPPVGATGAIARIKGEDPRQQVHQALREAKALLEVGEIIRPDAPSTTHPGLGGKLVQAATRVAQGEGRL
ncbi:MAG: hypothetical protein ACRDTF_16675 [Pseudonocardiaceae bacterium]